MVAVLLSNGQGWREEARRATPARESLARRPGCHVECFPWTGTSTVRAFPETPWERGEHPNVLSDRVVCLPLFFVAGGDERC